MSTSNILSLFLTALAITAGLVVLIVCVALICGEQSRQEEEKEQEINDRMNDKLRKVIERQRVER